MKKNKLLAKESYYDSDEELAKADIGLKRDNPVIPEMGDKAPQRNVTSFKHLISHPLQQSNPSLSKNQTHVIQGSHMKLSEKIQLAYKNIIYFTTRVSSLERLLFLNEPKEEEAAYLLNANAVSPSSARKTTFRTPWNLLFNRAFTGMRHFSDTLFPLIFSAFFLHDLIYFTAYPDERYGNSFADLLLGTSPNEESTTSHWMRYWPTPHSATIAWPATLASLLVSSISFSLLDLLRFKDRRHLLKQNLDDVNHFLKFHKISKLELSLLFDELLPFDKKEALLSKMTREYPNANMLVQLRMLSIFAKITDRHTQPVLQRLAKEILFSPETQSQSSLWGQAYQYYLQWTLGTKSLVNSTLKNTALHALFLLYTYGIKLPIKIRLWMLYAEFLQSMITWFDNKNDCEKEHRFWDYWSTSSRYECTIAHPSWPIYYLNRNDADASFRDFIRLTQSPLSVIKVLEHFRHFGIHSADFSDQNWQDWTDENWQDVLNHLANAITTVTDNFSLTSSSGSSSELSPNKTMAVADFVQKTNVSRLSLENQFLGRNASLALFQHTLGNETLTSLNLGNTKLHSDAIPALSQWIALLPQLEEGIFNSNSLSDDSLSALIPGIAASNLRSLDLSNNAFSSNEIIQLLMQQLPATLTSLNLSSLDLTELDMLTFCQSLAKSAIQTLQLNATFLSDNQLAILFSALPSTGLLSLQLDSNSIGSLSANAIEANLPTSSLQTLSLNNNSISDDAFLLIIQGTVNSNVGTLSLENNNISDSGIQNAELFLQQSSVHILSLRNNNLTSASLPFLATVLTTNNALQHLSLEGSVFDDDKFIAFCQVLSTRISPFYELNIANCQLTEKSAEAINLLIKSNNLQLSEINISKNTLENEGLQIIAKSLPAADIKKLHLSACGISSVEPLVSVLPHTNIELLDLSNNPLKTRAGIDLAGKMVSSLPDASKLGDASLSWDEHRVLSHTIPTTHLQSINMTRTNATTNDARALCRVLPFAGINSVDSIKLSQNAIESNNVDLRTCQTSAASSATPQWVLLPSTFISTATYYLRALPSPSSSRETAARQQNQRSSSNFFVASGISPFLISLAALYLLYYITKKMFSSNENRIVATPNNASDGYEADDESKKTRTRRRL